jgi:hypothetical protein
LLYGFSKIKENFFFLIREDCRMSTFSFGFGEDSDGSGHTSRSTDAPTDPTVTDADAAAAAAVARCSEVFPPPTVDDPDLLNKLDKVVRCRSFGSRFGSRYGG